MRWWTERSFETKFFATSSIVLILLMSLTASGLEFVSGYWTESGLYRASQFSAFGTLLLPFICGTAFLYLRRVPELLGASFGWFSSSVGMMANEIFYSANKHLLDGPSGWREIGDVISISVMAFIFGLSINVLYHYAFVFIRSLARFSAYRARI